MIEPDMRQTYRWIVASLTFALLACWLILGPAAVNAARGADLKNSSSPSVAGARTERGAHVRLATAGAPLDPNGNPAWRLRCKNLKPSARASADRGAPTRCR